MLTEPLLAECHALAAKGLWVELCRVAARRLDVAEKSPSLITLYAEALLRSGNPHDARRWLDERDSVLVKSADRAAIRRAVNLAGAASFEHSDLENAQLAFERALDLGRIDGDDLLVARATNNLAVISTIRSRHDEALALYAVALAAYQRLGNVNGLAESYHNAAIAHRKLRQLKMADEHEQRATEFARQVGNNHLVAIILVGRAEISLLRGDAALAEAKASRAATELAAIPDPSRQADAVRLCGAARLALGKLREACEALDTAVELAATYGNTLIEAESRWTRAHALLADGQLNAALLDAERAATFFEKLKAPAELTAVNAWLAVQRRPVS